MRPEGWAVVGMIWWFSMLATCHMNDGWLRVEERKIDAMERCK